MTKDEIDEMTCNEIFEDGPEGNLRCGIRCKTVLDNPVVGDGEYYLRDNGEVWKAAIYNKMFTNRKMVKTDISKDEFAELKDIEGYSLGSVVPCEDCPFKYDCEILARSVQNWLDAGKVR